MLSVVVLATAQVDQLRPHIVGSSTLGLQDISAFSREYFHESKVSHLHVYVFPQEDVLELKITMSYSLGVDVLNSIDQLAEKLATDGLFGPSEATSILYVLK